MGGLCPKCWQDPKAIVCSHDGVFVLQQHGISQSVGSVVFAKLRREERANDGEVTAAVTTGSV